MWISGSHVMCGGAAGGCGLDVVSLWIARAMVSGSAFVLLAFCFSFCIHSVLFYFTLIFALPSLPAFFLRRTCLSAVLSFYYLDLDLYRTCTAHLILR
jgi:hypothetical protein